MSSPDFKHALASWNVRTPEEIRDLLQKVEVKIIEHRLEKHEELMSSSWVQELLAEGINVSVLSNPCILERVPGAVKKGTISTPELRHAFEEKQWGRIMKEMAGGACAISNIRGLNEALEQNPKAEMIITVEGDVEPTKNVLQLIACLVPNFLLNRELQNCQYVALSFANWHNWHDSKVRQKSKMVQGSWMPPYFKVLQLPMSQVGQQQWRYDFVGQGSRALALRREFAQEICETKISDWYDLFLLGLVSQKRMKSYYSHKDQPNMACLVDPPLFTHEPDFSERFRGSGRLKSLATNEAEESSYYICVDLGASKYGYCNRVQTVALMVGLAGVFRYGLYINWPQNEACTNKMEEVVQLQESAPLYTKVPFVTVFDDRDDPNWIHAKKNRTWCRGVFEQQCEVQIGIDLFLSLVESTAQNEGREWILNNLLPDLKTELTAERCWETIGVPQQVESEVDQFLATFRDTKYQTKTGFHCRRGDYAWFNWKKKMNDLHNPEERETLNQQWIEADETFMDSFTSGEKSLH